MRRHLLDSSGGCGGGDLEWAACAGQFSEHILKNADVQNYFSEIEGVNKQTPPFNPTVFLTEKVEFP